MDSKLPSTSEQLRGHIHDPKLQEMLPTLPEAQGHPGIHHFLEKAPAIPNIQGNPM